MSKLLILVIEDNPLARKLMETHLQEHNIEFANDFASGRQKLGSAKYDMCFIDLKLGDNDDECSGLKLIPLATEKKIYTVVMSGHDSETYIEKAYALGCDDFYSKGNEETNVNGLLNRFTRRHDEPSEDNLFTERFITEDHATRASICDALKYAGSDLPVLILGASGTGKTSLAKLVHDHSGRNGAFVSINCAAYTEDLLEAELFGYKKGAFTGAADKRQGKLMAANQGTLFLDEIGAMSLKMQTKLLKAIEEKTFFPLGSDKPETSNFRIISATLEDVQGMVKSGKLRFDFFQRVHGLTINLKPLVERKNDIFPLVSFFTRTGKRLGFEPQAKDELLAYGWPGNVRELKKFVDLAVAGEEGRVCADTARALLTKIRIEDNQGDLISDAQYQYALRHGLNKAVDSFVDEIVKRNLDVNEGKKTKVLEDLKISTRLLYSSMDRVLKPMKKENKHGK
ncbi:sigma-54-dependent transcriptional regulator [Elusimicrobiota bacterium]